MCREREREEKVLGRNMQAQTQNWESYNKNTKNAGGVRYMLTKKKSKKIKKHLVIEKKKYINHNDINTHTPTCDTTCPLCGSKKNTHNRMKTRKGTKKKQLFTRKRQSEEKTDRIKRQLKGNEKEF